ncbi:MAG: hypothetical protein Q9207_005248, partial [Kuettlingeria erythrocarpa]
MFGWLHRKYEYELGAGGMVRTRVDDRRKVESNGPDRRLEHDTDAARIHNPRSGREVDPVPIKREGAKKAAQVIYHGISATKARQGGVTRGLDGPTLVATESRSSHGPRHLEGSARSRNDALRSRNPERVTRGEMKASREKPETLGFCNEYKARETE